MGGIILGRYYPYYGMFFYGHGSDLFIGLLTGVVVSIGGGIVSKVLSEKKDLTIASQEYGRYCGKICTLLKLYKNENVEILNEILDLIRTDPFFFGFCFTESKALVDMSDILNRIESSILDDEFNEKIAYSYSGELYRARLKIISAKYKFYLLGKKKLVKQTIKKDEEGNLIIIEKYKH